MTDDDDLHCLYGIRLFCVVVMLMSLGVIAVLVYQVSTSSSLDGPKGIYIAVNAMLFALSGLAVQFLSGAIKDVRNPPESPAGDS